MSHHHHSHHEGHHHHTPAHYGFAFGFGIVLNTIFIIVEAAYGVQADSLSLLADAGHNLGDVLGLFVAWIAVWMGKRNPTCTRTYGLKKASILAALCNASLLLVAIGGIIWGVAERIASPAPVAGKTVMIVAGIGIIINSVTALFFMSGRKKDINIRGAFLHMAADAIVSLGVVVSGCLILWTGWQWIDPLVSACIAITLLIGTWGLLKESLHLSVDGVPSGIHLKDIHSFLQNVPGVTDVHDLHVWHISTTEAALTVHLMCPKEQNDDSMIHDVRKELHDRFAIEHATIQVERGTIPCPFTSCTVPVVYE